MRPVAAAALFAAAALAACDGPEADGTANEVPIRADGLAPAPGVYPFQGVWAGEGASCEDAGLDLEDGPLVITTESLQFFDTPCAVAAVEEVGAAAYDVAMRCGGAGADTTMRLSVEGDTLLINDNGEARTYRRCEAEEPQP